MTEETQRSGRAPGLLARLLATRWFGWVAASVALLLVATTAVVATQKFLPDSAAAPIAESAPTAFALQLTAVTPPAVRRGDTVELQLEALSPNLITRIEFWEDDHLWAAIDAPEQRELPGGQFVGIPIDYVPIVAGTHTLMARAIDDQGLVAQSLPLAAAVLDLPEDLEVTVTPAILLPGGTPAPTISLRSLPGDTVSAVAGRLGVAEGAVQFVGRAEIVGGVIPTGQEIISSLPRAQLITPDSFRFPVIEWRPGIRVENSGCSAVITAENSDQTQLVYASPDFTLIGKVEPGGTLVLDMLPLGTTTFVAYVPGAKDDVTGYSNAPSLPVTVQIPDECVFQGWEGNAWIANTTLLTTVGDVENAYLYIAFDQGEWQRVPAQEGTFLPASNLVNLSDYLVRPNHHDQIDLELWSYSGGDASRVADGRFCLASVPNISPSWSTGSGGPCMPKGAQAKTSEVTGPQQISLALSPVSLAREGLTTHDAVTQSQPNVGGWVTLNQDTPVTLLVSTKNTRVNTALVQFSYLPISQYSPSLNPPGVFKTQTISLAAVDGGTARRAEFTVNPWLLQFARITGEDRSQITTESGEALTLYDEVALSLATSALEADRNLIDRVYIRVVAAEAAQHGSSPPNPLPFASSNMLVDFGIDDSQLPLIPAPTIDLRPGIQQSQSAKGYNGHCIDVQSYPEENTWLFDPAQGPKFSYPGSDVEFEGYPEVPGDFPTRAGNPAKTDANYARGQFPQTDVIYCELPGETDRYFAYMAQADDERERIAAKCGLGCILTTTLMGAYVGLLAGGPFGALVGAGIGLGLGLASVALPGLYAALTTLWDAIAAFYNEVYSLALKVAVIANPLCYAAEVVDDDGEEVCAAVTKTIGTAVVTAVTGLPPQIPMHDAIATIASGDLTALLVTGMDLALGAAGLDCDTFTIEGSTFIAEGSKAVTQHEATVALEASKDPVTGNYSGCQAMATIVMNSVRRSIESAHTQMVAYLGSYREIPGFILRPIVDRSPILDVRSVSPGSPVAGEPLTCPALVTLWVTRNAQVPGQNYYAYYDSQLVPIETTLTKTYERLDGPDGALSAVWSASVPLPVLPDLNTPDGAVAALGTTSTAQSPYLRAEVDSRCFEAVHTISANKYDTTANPFGYSAYHVDTRPVVIYEPDFFPAT